MKALLIFGMQVDLLPGSPAEVPSSNELVPIINRLIPLYDLVVAANFHLPADHVIFAANHLWRRPGQMIKLDGHDITLQHLHCVQDSFGAEMIPGLQLNNKLAFTALMGTEKQVLPHSAFFDYDKKIDTGLAQFLAHRKVNMLHLAGMPMEDGLANTAMDSMALGIKTRIWADACRGRYQPAFDAALQRAVEAGCEVFNSGS